MTKRWRDIGSLYQIYPRSFQDTTGDGVGDLNGITARLNYLSCLGIEAIWISPFFTSPMTDFGYDVANYRDVDPTFGAVDDFRRLIAEAHARNIKVMIDLVPCHTSDQHPWFVESRSSLDNPKRDYYVWKDPKPDDSPPNNWRSQSGGRAWTLDEKTGQYYLHSFLYTQPDLNWDNPAVRREITDVVRFWFDMGVDGMRVDAIWGISKDPEFGDDSPNPHPPHDLEQYGAFIHDHCKYGPHFAEYLREIASVCDEFEDRQLVFEFYPDEQLGNIYEQYRQVIHAHPRGSAFFMEHRHMSWHAQNTRDAILEYMHRSVGNAIPFFCLGNHDQPRVVSRLDYERARALNFLNLLTPGISVVYYGDEIGMENGVLDATQLRDNFSPANSTVDSRDLERTPMQWSDSQFADFSTAEPWLPVHANRVSVNVAKQTNETRSMLTMHQTLLKLRQAMPILVHGSLEAVDVGNGFILGLKRVFRGQRAYIFINFANAEQYIHLPEPCQIITSTHPWIDFHMNSDQITLPSHAGVLLVTGLADQLAY